MKTVPTIPVTDAASFDAATHVSRETLSRLNLYESQLKLWQKHINLVAPATLSEAWGRHFFDSAQLLELVPADARVFADLGSGAGFPGLVLAIMLQGGAKGGGAALSACVTDASSLVSTLAANNGADVATAAVTAGSAQEPLSDRNRAGAGILTGVNSVNPSRFVLIESDQRKGAFLREVARQTGVAVEILSTRIENPETHAKVGLVDVVTARALAPLDRLLELAAPLFGPRTVGLFLKGRGAGLEVQAARSTWAFDASLVPSLTAAEASIVVVQNLRRLGAGTEPRSR